MNASAAPWCRLELSGLPWDDTELASGLAAFRKYLESFGCVVEVDMQLGPHPSDVAGNDCCYVDPSGCWCCLELSHLCWGDSELAVTLASLRQYLQGFGCVVSVEMEAGPPPRLHVLYSNPADAAAAREALCGAGGYGQEQWPAYGEDFMNSAFFLRTYTGYEEWLASSEDAERASANIPTPTNSETESLADRASEADAVPTTWRSRSTNQESSSATSMSAASAPRFIDSSVAISQLDWGSFNKGQEWRQDLLLRGLPQPLCHRERLEALLREHSLGHLARGIRVLPRKGPRSGAAIICTTSIEAAERLAKFFHGVRFGVGASPIAVSFAPRQNLGGRGSLDLPPMHVQSSHCPKERVLLVDSGALVSEDGFEQSRRSKAPLDLGLWVARTMRNGTREVHAGSPQRAALRAGTSESPSRTSATAAAAAPAT
eukprot:CAMPEP_0171067854 /NCGR_PEP_ID=MMETSP0766_2-20121228/8232_1 /TAXON_ID=439317 /ORGANISM="Gambierdiscus australes, Strain CAWD 149" /LENGTH=430 /DNA_ID=CAMNT_0011524119 /DNA_START=27 /DNA_END=1316 /DNA_ORIENTATION=+